MDSAAQEPEWMARLRSNRAHAQGLDLPATADLGGAPGDGPIGSTEPSCCPEATPPEPTPRRIIADGSGRTVADAIARAAREVGKRYGLDARYTEVLTRVAQSWEYAAIAKQLGISESETANRVARIRWTTRTDNRHELVRLVFEEIAS